MERERIKLKDGRLARGSQNKEGTELQGGLEPRN